MLLNARLALLCGALTAGLWLSAAEARPWAPYAEVHGIFAKFLGVSPADRDRLTFHLGVKPPVGITAPNDVRLMIVSGGTERRIPINSEWHLLLPLDERLLRENPTITTNLAPDKPLILRPQMSIEPLPGREWPAAELAIALRQANAAVRAQAGIYALFAPKAKAVLFRFGDPGASVRADDRQGTRLFAANAAGDVEVMLDNRMTRNNARLQLSAAPRSVLPKFPMSMTLTVDADAK